MSNDIAGYQFKNKELLEQALTHPSLSKKYNNQRLEFLGDAVLARIIAEALYEQYPQEQEGQLARRHSALVCGETLTKLAEEIGLGEHLKLSESEIQSGGRSNASNLEDVCEALIGAIFLDGGSEAVREWVLSHWQRLIDSIAEPPKDAKTTLQEWAQGRGLGLPQYKVVDQSGPAHAPNFTVEVSVESQGKASANAGSKKQAEQEAAAKLLEQIA